MPPSFLSHIDAGGRPLCGQWRAGGCRLPASEFERAAGVCQRCAVAWGRMTAKPVVRPLVIAKRGQLARRTISPEARANVTRIRRETAARQRAARGIRVPLLLALDVMLE